MFVCFNWFFLVKDTINMLSSLLFETNIKDNKIDFEIFPILGNNVLSMTLSYKNNFNHYFFCLF